MNNISQEELKEQGDIRTLICCEECDYETDIMSLRDAVFMINMQGGYFMWDGEGGPISKCPKCGEEGLHTVD